MSEVADIKTAVEDEKATSLSPASVDIDDGFDPAVIKALRRKIDWKLVPPLAALYAVSLIDRNNLGLAGEAGMTAELKLNIDNRYSHAVLAFFPPYVALELFSNIGMRRVGARWWLPSAVVVWAICLFGTAFVKNWQGLTALRAVSGGEDAMRDLSWLTQMSRLCLSTDFGNGRSDPLPWYCLLVVMLVSKARDCHPNDCILCCKCGHKDPCLHAYRSKLALTLSVLPLIGRLRVRRLEQPPRLWPV